MNNHQQQPAKNQNSEQKRGQQAWNSSDKTANAGIKNANQSNQKVSEQDQKLGKTSNASTEDRVSKEFAPRSNLEVNPGRYNEDLKDTNESTAQPDSFKNDQNSTRAPIKNQNNDSQAV